MLEHKAWVNFAALRACVVFTDGDPAKALEETERMVWGGPRPAFSSWLVGGG